MLLTGKSDIMIAEGSREKEMRCLFLYNPVSGRGKIAKKLDHIVRVLERKYDAVDTYATKQPGDMARAAAESAEKYDALIFSGGDGSFNEVVQGVAGAARAPELGYIPCGTVNDIAHSLGIPKRIDRALKVVLEGECALLDCMKINDRYAMYIVAAGAFTSATYSTPQTLKHQVGRLAYGLEGLRKNMNFEVFDIDISAGKIRERTDCVFVALMNGRYVAGMRLNKRGSMRDGKIEAAVIRQCKKPNFFQKVRAYISLASLFLFGYGVRKKNIFRVEGSHFEIDAGDSVVWNFDGEKGISGKVVIDVLPKKIVMLVPRERKKI